MPGLFRLLILVLFSVGAISAGQAPVGPRAQDGATLAEPRQPSQTQVSSASGVAAVPSYPDSPRGLESLIEDMLALEKRSDTVALAPYFQSLVFPNPEAWFKSEFGDEHCGDKQLAANDCLGSRLALTYESTARNLPAAAAKTVSDLLGDGLTNFEAVNYTELCPGPQRIVPARKLVGELTTMPILSSVLSGLVRNHEPVYVLWAYAERKETTIAFFVYSEGAFRYIGMPHPASFEDFARVTAATQEKTEAIQAGSNAVSSDDLTNEVLDVQPALADQKLIERTVVLSVVIGTNGKVREATYVRGPEEFKDAAIRSVKQRNFGRQVFGGQSMQVTTCISVESHR